MSRLLLETKVGSSVVLTLNRPAARNAINAELREALRAALSNLVTDDEVRLVLLTGAESAFCAGGDVGEMRQRLEAPSGAIAASGLMRQRATSSLVAALRDLPQLTVAAVNGPAVGLGLDLALACDFIVASTTSFFSASFIQRGLVPDSGTLYHLPRRVGLARAKELVLSGRRLDAGEAHSLGLVDLVTTPEELLDRAREYGEALSQGPRLATDLAKALLNRSLELSPESVAALVAEAQAMCYTSDDHRDAVAAFLDRSDAASIGSGED